ncbi:MAG: hypothetical protein H6620_12430 [Halobacteriovoraceae bacterium]|nr:hypothetical protein [Halobacteriovoraceae bacterium]
MDNQGPVKRCSLYPKHELNVKNELSVISDQHKDLILSGLRNLEHNTGKKIIAHKQGELLAILFETLMATGMRKNEALGLSLDSIKIGKTREDYGFVFDAVKENGIKSWGYIYLLDQPKLKCIRDKKGEVPRKPLKLKKKISAKNSRLIPLMDEEVTKKLLGLMKEQLKAWEEQKYGSDRKNYLLFEGLHYQSLNRALNQLYGKRFIATTYLMDDCPFFFKTAF